MSEPIKVGDRVRRLGYVLAEVGTVIEVAERPSRTTDSGQRVVVELRIRVKWPDYMRHDGPRAGPRTWLAVSGEGSRWERVTP